MSHYVLTMVARYLQAPKMSQPSLTSRPFPGSGFRLHLDENGVGYIPRALAGSTLVFNARSYLPAVISDWGGEQLDVQFEKRSAP